MPIYAPYTTEKYIEAINLAVKAGYDWVIVDSTTHAWAGEGGLLDQKEQRDGRGGNTYTNWAPITKKQEAFKASLQNSPIHLIATMRSKQDYVIVEKNGKSTPQKVGLAPVQREGMEYEFTLVLDVAMNHEAEVSKDRTGLFAGKLFKITQETGKELKGWLESGVKVESNPKETPVAHSTYIDPADFVCQVGKKYIGKKLSEIEVFELNGFVENTKKWFSEEANKKHFTKDWSEFFEYAEAYLASKEVQPLDPPESIADEVMP
jgi:hypothetical protein